MLWKKLVLIVVDECRCGSENNRSSRFQNVKSPLRAQVNSVIFKLNVRSDFRALLSQAKPRQVFSAADQETHDHDAFTTHNKTHVLWWMSACRLKSTKKLKTFWHVSKATFFNGGQTWDICRCYATCRLNLRNLKLWQEGKLPDAKSEIDTISDDVWKKWEHVANMSRYVAIRHTQWSNSRLRQSMPTMRK